MKLPNRLFYSLDEAAIELSKNEETKCTINDLLHFAAIGATELLFFIDGEWITSGQFIDDGRVEEICIPTIYNEENPNITLRCELKDDMNFHSNLCDISIYKTSSGDESYPPDSFIILVSGLMGFIPTCSHLSFFTKLKLNGFVDFSWALIHAPFFDDDNSDGKNEFSDDWINQHFAISFENKSITQNDLYISYSELEILRNGGRDKEGNVTKSKLTAQNIRDRKHQISSKRKNDYLRFIIALIEVVSPESLSKPHSAVLRRKLSKCGVDMPISEKTLSNWIADHENLPSK